MVVGERSKPGAGQPVEVARAETAGEFALLFPVAPSHRDGRQTLRAAVVRQRVEESVGGRVVGLSGGSEGRRRRRVQHERREVEVLGQFVQCDRRVDLGTQYRADPVGGQRPEHTVVHDARGVHDGGQRVLGRDVREHGRELVAVGGVAGDDPHPRTQPGELGVQVVRAVGLRTTTAREHKVPHAVRGDEVLGEQATEGAGATGYQHGAVGVKFPSGRGAFRSCEPRHEHSARTQCDLRFVERDRAGQHVGGRRVVVGVDQHEPAGVLGLRGPHGPPQCGVGEVEQVVTDRAVRQHDELVLRGTVTQELQQPGGRRVRLGDDVTVDRPEVQHLGQVGSLPHRDRRPHHVEQRVAQLWPCVDLVGGGGSQHEVVHLGDGCAARIRGQQRH